MLVAIWEERRGHGRICEQRRPGHRLQLESIPLHEWPVQEAEYVDQPMAYIRLARNKLGATLCLRSHLRTVQGLLSLEKHEEALLKAKQGEKASRGSSQAVSLARREHPSELILEPTPVFPMPLK